VKSYTNFVPPDETTQWLNGVIGLVALNRYDEAKALFRPGPRSQRIVARVQDQRRR